VDDSGHQYAERWGEARGTACKLILSLGTWRERQPLVFWDGERPSRSGVHRRKRIAEFARAVFLLRNRRGRAGVDQARHALLRQTPRRNKARRAQLGQGNPRSGVQRRGDGQVLVSTRLPQRERAADETHVRGGDAINRDQRMVHVRRHALREFVPRVEPQPFRKPVRQVQQGKRELEDGDGVVQQLERRHRRQSRRRRRK
jgi:hypothetical protein